MKPVLFSVSYAGFWGQAALDLRAFVAHAAELGYPAVEIMAKRPHLSVLDYGLDDIHDLAAHCRACGVDVACVAGYTNFSGGAESSEVPFIEMQVAYTRTLAQFAQGLDCGLVRVFTSYERDDVPLAENWSRTVKAIQECCAVAADSGVTIGIQNHHDVGVHSKALLELLRASATGLFHFGGSDFMTRLALVQRIAAYFGLDASEVESMKTADAGQAATRPLRSGLRSDRISQTIGREPMSLEEGLERLAEQPAFRQDFGPLLPNA